MIGRSVVIRHGSKLRELQPNEVRSKRLARLELKADDCVAVEGFAETSQGVGTAVVLSAFDAGDH